MLERVVGQAGEARERMRAGCRDAVDGDRIEVVGTAFAPLIGRAANDRLAGSAEMLENGQRGSAPSPKRKAMPATLRGVSPSCDSSEYRDAGARCSRRLSNGWPCRLSVAAFGERPAQPSRRQAKGAWLRHDCHLLAVKIVHQHNADPVPQRVAACQHRNPRAPPRRMSPIVSLSALRHMQALCPAVFRPAAPSPDSERRRPASLRSRPACGRPALTRRASSSPMPMTLSQPFIPLFRGRQQRVDRGGRSALPPRRPFSVI